LRGSQNLEHPDFDVLLRRFDSDSKRGIEKYESLRRRLVKYFEWNNCFSASEDLVDLTMDAVARKPSEFVIDDVVAYSRGVARNIIRQFHGRSAREILLPDIPEVNDSAQDLEEHLISGMDLVKTVNWLNQCLHKLKSEDRDLVLEYYNTQEPTHIAHREKLARTVGVSMNALRVRVNRIRDRLEECLESKSARRTK
jgi:DNA-directed RNA polymerase specialized sigma24 family protein